MKYLLFNGIRKACPEGQHYHYGGMTCHDITKPHKAGTKANEWHRKHGLVTSDGDGKPESGEKTPPKGEGEKKPVPESENSPEETPKKVGRKRDITPDTSGTAKAPILQITRGWSKQVMSEKFPKAYSTAESISEKLTNFDAENGKIYTDLHEDFSAIGIDMSDELNNMYQPLVQNVVNDMAGVISEYPLGAKGLKKITVEASRGSAMMFFRPSDMAISFCPEYFSESGGRSSVGNEPETYDHNVIDPVTKEASKWSFHPHGSMNSQSFSHEYGHLEQQLITLAYSHSEKYFEDHPDEIPESILQERKKADKIKEDFIKKVCSMSPNVVVDKSEIYPNTGMFFVSIYSDEKIDAHNKDYQKVLKGLKGMKYMRYDRSRLVTYMNGPYHKKSHPNAKESKYHTSIAFVPDTKNGGKNAFKMPPSSRLCPISPEKLLKDGHGQSIDDLLDSGNKVSQYSDTDLEVSQAIVAQCEELYKELYKVEKIIPSDVYTGYGYFGEAGSYNKATWGDDDVPVRDITEELNFTLARCAQERIAEAYNDVMVRGDKANSMATLIVSCCEYELARCLTGEEESFAEFLRGNYDFSKVGEPIIKTRAIRYHLFR